MTLGAEIKQARQRKRWTQAQLAEALEVSEYSVSAWERDVSIPRTAMAALRDVLGMDLGANTESRGQGLENADLSAEVVRRLGELDHVRTQLATALAKNEDLRAELAHLRTTRPGVVGSMPADVTEPAQSGRHASLDSAG